MLLAGQDSDACAYNAAELTGARAHAQLARARAAIAAAALAIPSARRYPPSEDSEGTVAI
jgi:hypothetical protein